MSQSDKLKNAGLMHGNHNFTAEEIAAIDALSDAEVETLIAVHGKLGEGILRKKVDDTGEANPETLIL